MTLDFGEGRTEQIRFLLEWAKLGRSWARLMALSPDLSAYARAEMGKLQQQMDEIHRKLRELGLRPPKGTS